LLLLLLVLLLPAQEDDDGVGARADAFVGAASRKVLDRFLILLPLLLENFIMIVSLDLFLFFLEQGFAK
jgi:hypothetical protein